MRPAAIRMASMRGVHLTRRANKSRMRWGCSKAGRDMLPRPQGFKFISKIEGASKSSVRVTNPVQRGWLVFQLALTAEKSWRKIRGFKRLPEVIEGIRFQDGIAVITEPEKTEQTQQMAA